MKLEMPYSSVSGVCSCSRASFSHCGCISALTILNLGALLSSHAGSSLECNVCTMSAAGLTFSKSACTACTCASLTRSSLLSTSTSANSSCSQSSCDTVRWSPSEACQLRSTSVSMDVRCSKRAAASTTVTRACRLTTSERLKPDFSSLKVKVSATWSGSEMPEDSTITWSKRRSAARFARVLSRSSRSVQQMQPLESSTIFSSVCSTLACLTSCASTFMLAMSFTTTAMRWPERFSSKCFSRVVFPAPKNPDRTVTGSWTVCAPLLASRRLRRLFP
mmetsp:Transcript_39098/g.85922  ORF Transcript_39098/g.85922 Transcript_39098/m.85922 type:complete len:277 (-) Transcript_39098:1651-2481(-)